MFVSGDSGDWLAASTIWMVPQPFGSPLYITLGHVVNTIFPNNLPAAMTIILSVIPAAITVGLVYLILRALDLDHKYAILGAVALLACGVYLSQATVLEEYAIATMFCTLGLYCHTKKHYTLTALFLGLGTAVHVIIGAIACLWAAVSYKEWRTSWKSMLPTFIVCGVLPYSLILALMASPSTPKWIAGNLSLESLNSYLGSTGTVGALALQATPQRLSEAIPIILLSFGPLLIPLAKGLQKPHLKLFPIACVTLGFCLWLYITDSDPSTWTFLTFTAPVACIVIGIGLSHLPKWYYHASVGFLAVLLIANSILLNANVLTDQYPIARNYYESTTALPAGSSLVVSHGGPYGLGAMYIAAQGKPVELILMEGEEGWNSTAYQDYLEWSSIPGDNWIEQVEYCLDYNIPVYIHYAILPPEHQQKVDNLFTLEKINEYWYQIK